MIKQNPGFHWKKRIDVNMILMKKAAQVPAWDWYNFPTQQIVLTVTIQFAQPYQHVHPHHRNHHHHHHHLYQTDTDSITNFFRTTPFTQSSSSLKGYFESHNPCLLRKRYLPNLQPYDHSNDFIEKWPGQYVETIFSINSLVSDLPIYG